MREITLTNCNKFVLVDDEHYDELSKQKWFLMGGYAMLTKKPYILMHRKVMDCPENKEVDHINHDKLDNRKCNLRVCSHSENHSNTKMHYTNKARFKGVSLHGSGKYEARIRVNKVKLHLGLFRDKYLAAIAYDKAALKYFGNFAFLNHKKVERIEGTSPGV